MFWQKGYTAALGQDLTKTMEIGQGSFYRSFPGGKKELYQKSLKRFLEVLLSIEGIIKRTRIVVCFIVPSILRGSIKNFGK